MAYTEVANVKEYLEISSSELDDLIEKCVDATTDLINHYCGQKFESHGQGQNNTEATRYFHAIDDVVEEKTMLLLDEPLALITSVVNGDGTTLTSNQYVTQPYTDPPYYALILIDGTTWQYVNTPYKAIAVTGHWAYSTTTPEEIAFAATELAAYLFQKRQSNMDSDRAIVSDDGLLLTPDGIPRHILFKLNAFKRRML